MENTEAPAVLLLPGFGVGTFHYEQQLQDLGQEYRVWAMDFLGQGKSWPSHDPAPGEDVVEEVVEGQAKSQVVEWGSGKTAESWATDLVYSVDTWRDQVHAFVEKVIGGPVYIVGNSLGGYVATYFATTNPELVKGVVLLNATPFWAFMPNARRYPWLARFVPWAGLLPVPAIAKAAIRVWWNILRNPQLLRRAVTMVYADRSVVDEKLVQNMKAATDHPAAFAAFASIMFAPQAHTNFKENLISLKEKKMPMCMIYGKEDPWVVPFWGQRAKQRNPDAIYYEISPAGHCPHHEAPEVVNVLLRRWMESIESEGAVSPLLLETGKDKQERQFVVERSSAGVKRVSVRLKETRGFWGNLVDSIREMFAGKSLQSQVVETVEKSR
jgi:pimeloyl-ACP methyl ester carboxylesterase